MDESIRKAMENLPGYYPWERIPDAEMTNSEIFFWWSVSAWCRLDTRRKSK